MGHRVRWFVRVGDGEWIPRQASMRGLWFYDARCSCGWESRTGGATERHVRDLVAAHRADTATTSVRVNGEFAGIVTEHPDGTWSACTKVDDGFATIAGLPARADAVAFLTAEVAR